MTGAAVLSPASRSATVGEGGVEPGVDNSTSDAALMARYCGGDGAAFDALY